jgi:hypothetical protein
MPMPLALLTGNPLRRVRAPAPPQRPAWRQAMAAFTWAEVPTSNTLASLNPKNNASINPAYPGNPEWGAGHAAVITAWCGGCLDEATDDFWIPLGGGHADYAGNEPYKLNLRHDTPTWTMVRPPSGAVGNVLNTQDRPLTGAGSTTTAIVLASGVSAPAVYGGYDAASDEDDAYNGMTLQVSNQTRTITDYDGATHTATVGSAYSITVTGQFYSVISGGVSVHGALGEQSGMYADGRVRSTHTYNKPVWVPGVGPFIACLSSVSWSGQVGTDKPVRIDPVTGESTLLAASSVSMGSVGACYDPSRHAIWMRGAGTGKFHRYNIGTDTWTNDIGPNKAVSGRASLAYLADINCIVWICQTFTAGFALLDCATGTVYEPSVSGSWTADLASNQAAWVPSLNAVCSWNNSSDTTLISRLTRPVGNPRTDEWTLDTLEVDESNSVTPSARTANGTYGRFGYSPFLDGFYLLNSTSGPVYFFALS